MMQRGTWRAASVALVALAQTSLAQNKNGKPLSIPFNTTSGGLGPDGPWNHLTLTVGSDPASVVDFYPVFGVQGSMLVTQQACSTNKDCTNPAPNYYDQDSASAQQTGFNTTLTSASDYNTNLTGEGYYFTDNITEPTFMENITFWQTSNVTANFDKELFVPVSYLSMEPSVTATGSSAAEDSTGGKPGQYTALESYMSTTGGTDIVSMHLGSAAFNQSGSLYFGGYDQNRLIEPPAIYTTLGNVTISSLSFGHALGEDPWATKQPLPSNLLDGPVFTFLSPQVPGLYLPFEVCDRISQYLPINQDSATGLFLWDTTSPAYMDITTSPSYLNFTFLAGGSYTSIRVPFALLNLNLTQPLKNSPTPYFPCSAAPANGFSNLGRAFLQAAFLMQSYTTPAIILGQAPGPSVNQSASASVQAVPSASPNAQPGSNAPNWTESWASVLTPLSSAPTFTTGASPSASSASNNSSSGLSGGAIAGIVIGVVAGVGLIAGAVFFLIRGRRIVSHGPSPSVVAHPAPNAGPAAAQGEKRWPGSPGVYSPVSGTPGVTNASTLAPPFGGVSEIDSRSAPTVHEADAVGQQLGGAGQGFVAELGDTSRVPEADSTRLER